jgi:hypothetical protein
VKSLCVGDTKAFFELQIGVLFPVPTGTRKVFEQKKRYLSRKKKFEPEKEHLSKEKTFEHNTEGLTARRLEIDDAWRRLRTR